MASPWSKSCPTTPGRYQIRRVLATCECGGQMCEGAGEMEIFSDGRSLWAAPATGRRHARLLREVSEYEWREAQ